MSTILVVDDNEANRESLRRRLTRRGFDAIVAADGPAGLAHLNSGAVDLVLLDIMMPGMDGMEVLRHIRGSRDRSQLPVIMATAKDDASDIVAALERGANDYVTKPFDFDVVLARVQTQLQLKQSYETISRLEASLSAQNAELERANQVLTSNGERTKRELHMAARVQESLLPKSLPAVPQARFAWVFRPCSELAGDSLNVCRLNSDHIGIYVLDVSGHGVAASLLAVAASRALSPAGGSDSLLIREGSEGRIIQVPPAEVADRLNRMFAWNVETSQFITLFYATLNVTTREFTYVSAGHPPAIHLRDDHVQLLDHSGSIIGLGDAYEQRTEPLHAGDRVYVYSDGVTEAMDNQRQQFGTDRLGRVVEESRCLDLNASVDAILREVETWRGGPATDDVSILALELDATPDDSKTDA